MRILTVLILLSAVLSGCLQPDAPVEENQTLEIRHNNTAVTVIDIDPYDPSEAQDPNDIFYVINLNNGVPIPNANAVSSSDTIKVEVSGTGFIITGVKPGGMGVISFTFMDYSIDLKVFVRNWNKNEVFRHSIYADLENYPYDPDTDFHPTHYNGNPPYYANKLSAYQLIVHRGFHYESPDGLSSRNERNGTHIHQDAPRETEYRQVCPQPHILQRHDPFLSKDVFSFSLHYETDGDMVGGFDDRQRLELKTMDTGRASYPGSEDHPENFMYSTGDGDTFTYRWKFKLPVDFRVSNEYTHIHQIKPEGGDSGNPTFTLTGRRMRASGQEVLQLIYRGPIRGNGDPSVNWYPAQVPLEPFKGEWIRAETTITYDNPGAYRIRLVRIRDMRVLLEYIYSPEHYEEFDPFVMFRNGNSYVRPKFGVYRRIMQMTPFGLPDPANPVTDFLAENNEVTVLFADFEMDKLRR